MGEAALGGLLLREIMACTRWSTRGGSTERGPEASSSFVIVKADSVFDRRRVPHVRTSLPHYRVYSSRCLRCPQNTRRLSSRSPVLQAG